MANQAHPIEADAIVPHDRVGHDESLIATDPPPRRFVSIWASRIFMVLVLAAGGMALTDFTSDGDKKDQNLADGDQPGAGIIVRSEVLHIWLPPAFVEWATRQPSSGVMRTHEDLKRFLELRGEEKLWFAMTVRAHQTNGNSLDMPVVRQPYSEPILFPQFLDILAVAAENSSDDATDNFSSASVHVLPEKSMKCERWEVMAELQRHPYSLDGLDRRADSRGP
jgi:hypothetical protein